MPTLNDLQLSSREVQRYLERLDHAIGTIPYGTGLLQTVIDNFASLPPRFLYHRLTAAQKFLVSKCQEAYFFLAHRARDELYWIQNHENVRKRIVKLLSWNGVTYDMDGTELSTWCEEVFTYLKKCVARILRRKPAVVLERQLCVDAMHELVKLAQDLDDKARILQYYNYLIRFCQRASVSPSSFAIPYPLQSPKEPNETGASAVVYHGFHDKQEVAIKNFRLYYNTVPKIEKRFLKEALILRILHHPNVIPFIGVVQEPHRLCIITPWMRNGNIAEFLKANPDASGKELLEQVADGLHFMHEYKVVHGDLKGANVLINDEGKACISDFGIASIQEHVEPSPLAALNPAEEKSVLRRCREALRRGGRPQSLASSLSSRMSSFSGAGTLRWMAPERLIPEELELQSAKATFSSDVFSFAMLSIEVYSGEVPYHPVPQHVACLNTIAGRRPARPPNVPDLVWMLIKECWRADPAGRPSFLSVYNRLACLP